MNTRPSQTRINFASYPREFQEVILEKSQNFIDRPFIFTAINEFLHHHNRGYFTIVGVPGSGKSAILAKYVTENSNVVYYNAQVEGKNRAEEFLKDVCTQLIRGMENEEWGTEIPDNATEGSWFLSLLLQKISEKLEAPQRLIIAIDALDAIDRTVQPLGTNLFYLPRYLPNGIYFILTRRPFKREKSGLLIEVPSQILDLSEYSKQNWDDVPSFIQHWQKMKQEGLSDVALKVLRVLTSASKGGMSASAIAQIIDEDEYEVEEVLENWLEFLVQQRIETKTNYSFYHANFRNWLAARLSNGKIE
jgi:GTPase SAR1 family protein